MHKTVFFISDGTGITVETLGNTLLTQFETMSFVRRYYPHLKDKQAVLKVVEHINAITQSEGTPAMVFSSLIDMELRSLLKTAEAVVFDLFDIFVEPMEANLGIGFSRRVGFSHGIGQWDKYKSRMDAVQFAMDYDDGSRVNNFEAADVILIGVSRVGKTPTSLYLAINYGIHAANYPLTIEDMETGKLPDLLQPHREKLFGLSINPKRLQQIRQERRPNSEYSDLARIQTEIRSAEALFQEQKIAFLNSSNMSIEEIATHILHLTGLRN